MPKPEVDVEATCSVCGCGCEDNEMWIHGKCHMDAPTWAVLHGHTLVISCSQCKKQICWFAVAGGPYSGRPQ